MEHQGDVLARLVREAPGPPLVERAPRVLDVTAGIGTQSIPLAARGFDVTARDVSPGAIARLSREAAARGLAIDAATADMRRVADTVEGSFDAVIAMDNSVPHLTTEDDIEVAFRGFHALLRPGGRLALSVRDYETVDRSPTSVHPYGLRVRDGRTYRLGQTWTWEGPDHYRTTLVIEERMEDRWTAVVRAEAMYFAIPVDRLLALMERAGFTSCRRAEVAFHQPVLVGERS